MGEGQKAKKSWKDLEFDLRPWADSRRIPNSDSYYFDHLTPSFTSSPIHTTSDWFSGAGY